jgi:hypothetical protein
MGAAKPISLNVKPFSVSHLCFEVDGILGELHTNLGASPKPFDFPSFYTTLGAIPTVPGDPSRIRFGFLEIQAFAKPFALAALRAEPRKAALNKAINARQNAFFAKYANAPAIITLMNQFYSPAIAGSKPQRLTTLSALANVQAGQLKSAYSADGRTGVVRTTTSVLDSKTISSATSTETGQSDAESLSAGVGSPVSLPALPAGGVHIGASATGSGPVNEWFEETTSGMSSSSRGSANQHQTIENKDYAYRTPLLESEAQNERAQISLIDQRFAQFMTGQNLPYLAQVFHNELQSIDSDVFTLQIAYLNTILMSPVGGTITAVFKQPGDAVRAGEAVLRVEDSSQILLVGTVKYRGPIALGSTVTVQTSLFDSPAPPTTLTGSVVAVRGFREDDQWDVTVQCNNLDAGGNPIFPLGYHFDYDDTTVTIL